MDWQGFADEINGNYKEKSKNTHFAGKKNIKQISQKSNNTSLKIIKTFYLADNELQSIRLEKLSFKITLNNIHITEEGSLMRKSYFKKLIETNNGPIKIKGNITSKELITSSILSDLLHRPNSKLIIKNNDIIFKMKFQGPLEENLRYIYKSLIEIVKLIPNT